MRDTNLKYSYGFTPSCKTFSSDSSQAELPQSPAQSSQTKFRSIAAHSYGFTLAETLIAVAILGLLAAIVIPNMFKAYQQYQMVSKLKVAYALLNDVVAQSEAENDGQDYHRLLRTDSLLA